MQEISFSLGQTVFKQGDETNGLYLVLQGDFQMSKRDKYHNKNIFLKSNRNQELDIWIISKNEVFGHLECLDTINRTTTVRCIKNDSKAYFIPKSEIFSKFITTQSQKIFRKEKKNFLNLIKIREQTLIRVNRILELQNTTPDKKFEDKSVGKSCR